MTASMLDELVVPSRTGEKTLGPPNFAMVQVVVTLVVLAIGARLFKIGVTGGHDA